MVQFTWIGFKEIETQFYGAKCGVCQDTMEKRTKCMYNPITKEFRHFDCHVNHPSDLVEIWLVDKTETDEETLEPVARRTVLITGTRTVETARTQLQAQGITLIERLDSFPKGAKNPIEVRKHHMARLNLATKSLW